jgi:hypothetical protein
MYKIALFYRHEAGVAQSAEQLICNQQVISSSLIAGSRFAFHTSFFWVLEMAEKSLKE